MGDEPDKVVYIHTPKVVAWIVTVIAVLIIGAMILFMR